MTSLARTVEARAKRLGDRRAVFLPDLYVDVFVPLDSHQGFVAATTAIAARGGGNHPTSGHGFRIGGDAANTAYTMARLGVPVALVADADTIGRTLLQEATAGLPFDHALVRPAPQGSSTVALEFREGRRPANVMLSDPGPLAGFGPDRLSAAAWAAIDAADIVGVMNWSQNRTHGTALLRAVLPRARRAGAFTYLDSSDPRHRGDDVKGLVGDGEIMRHLSAWAMNEQEVACFAAAVTGVEDPDVERSIAGLRRAYPGRIDVHTERAAWSARGDDVVCVDVPHVDPRFRTGAGNAWNGGNLFATLLDLDDEARLRVANAVAGLTITAADRRPPDVQSLVRHLSKT